MRLAILFLFAACTDGVPHTETARSDDSSDTQTPDSSPPPSSVLLTVTLDGVPAEGVRVSQGAVEGSWQTGADGTVTVPIDWSVQGDIALHASHPDARIRIAFVREATHTIELTSFARRDNPDYTFQDPGDPALGQLNTSDRCGHCHVTMLEDWGASPHRDAASNPVVHDVFAGTAASAASEAACTSLGGRWLEGLGPGTAAAAMRCYLGDGVLPDLNEGCDPCDVEPTETGACADCHAPGINGVLGGHSLLDATGVAYEAGVHCDVCHKSESIDLTAPAGVHRLGILRPSEPEDSIVLGPYQPLMFGPWHDVANPRMGSVQRDHFGEAELCASCHQLEQEVLLPGASIDLSRWPSGRLPVHTTYAELKEGVLSAASCPDCHMPVDFVSGNGADLGNIWNLEQGIVGGWYRPVGEVNKHSFLGPRQDIDAFLESATSLSIEKAVDAGVLTAQVTLRNARPAHAVPTGEPLRHLLMLVEARCEAPLPATGGSVVADYGGALEVHTVGVDPDTWPEAQVGDLLRVVRSTGAWVDYSGFGPFGDGTFDAAAKGLAEEVFAGEATILAVEADGQVTLDSPLATQPGDRIVRSRASGLPTNGEAAGAWAGSPGFSWARVLTDDTGRRMVPHHRAVDVVSDNRLMAQASWTSTHTFATTCPDPTVEALILYRPYPLALASERGWALTERVIARHIR